MNPFHWLLILGFPPSDAAAVVMPEVFTAEGDDASAGQISH
jgi:hypothetical protein